VSAPEIIFTAVLIVVLVGLAGYYAWRQVQALRGLRRQENMPPDDRRYVRNQAWRRLACSGLMVVFAGLLAGWFFLGPVVENNIARGDAARAEQSEGPVFGAAEKPFVRFVIAYWIIALLVLLGMVILALCDILAIRRFGARHFRKLQADRRAMIERQAARLRHEGNGHH
jgi:hypothetical protein